jgi:hypothetical protein
MLVACVLSVVVFSRVQPVSVPARP